MTELTAEAFQQGIAAVLTALEPPDEVLTVQVGSSSQPYTGARTTEEVLLPRGASPNAILEVIIAGAAPSVSFQVESRSDAGGWVSIADPNGAQAGLTASTQVSLINLLKHNRVRITAVGTANVYFVFNFHAGTRPSTSSDVAGVVKQGAKDSTAQSWAVSVLDGSGNTQPAGDVATRPIFTELSDGTNGLGSTSHPVVVSDMPSAGVPITSHPAVNTQATVTQAAAGAGVKNVLNSISATVGGDATGGAAGKFTVVVRDGASGAGAILWQRSIYGTPGANALAGSLDLGGTLGIEGSANTQMTVEFTAAGGAHVFEEVSAVIVTTPI